MSAAGPRLAADDNWPQFRGPDGQGHAAGTGVPWRWSETENVRWKTPLHGRGWSSPVVWGNQVWLTTATEDGKQLYAMCVELATGRIVYDLKLFDVAEPAQIHTFNSYASPTPVIEEGRVYISFGSDGTACLDTHTGAVIWERRDLPCNHFRGPGSSPILFENLLIDHYDGFDYQYIVALDKETGRTVWKRDRDIDFGTADGDMKKAFCTPLVIEAAGRTQLISPCSKGLWLTIRGRARSCGKFIGASFPRPRPLFGLGLVFLNTGFGKAQLWAVRPDGHGDVTDTNVVWKLTKSVGSKPSPLLVNDLLYLVHDSGVASCIDAKTGKEIWSKRLAGEYSASPILADGRIYFCNDSGATTVLRPGRTYDELAVNHLDAGCMGSPAVVAHSLILRTKTHLYRIESLDAKTP